MMLVMVNGILHQNREYYMNKFYRIMNFFFLFVHKFDLG